MPSAASIASAALTENDGILRLAPTWVPRSFLQPGERLKLHPADYYALGTHRGGIDERWFALDDRRRQRRSAARTKGSATSSTRAEASRSATPSPNSGRN